MIDMTALRGVPLPLGAAARLSPREKTLPPPPAPGAQARASPVQGAASALKYSVANAAMCIASHLTDIGGSADCMHLLPAIRQAHNRPADQLPWGQYDLRIDVPLPEPSRLSPRPSEDAGVLTNPSVICRHGRLLLAARAIYPVMVQPPCTDIWRSATVIASVAYNASMRGLVSVGCVADLTRLNAVSFGDSGNEQAERCARQGLPHSVGLGGEDPRLFESGGRVFVSTNGPKAQREVDCGRLGRTMVLQRLEPLSPSVELHWSVVTEVALSFPARCCPPSQRCPPHRRCP